MVTWKFERDWPVIHTVCWWFRNPANSPVEGKVVYITRFILFQVVGNGISEPSNSMTHSRPTLSMEHVFTAVWLYQEESPPALFISPIYETYVQPTYIIGVIIHLRSTMNTQYAKFVMRCLPRCPFHSPQKWAAKSTWNKCVLWNQDIPSS